MVTRRGIGHLRPAGAAFFESEAARGVVLMATAVLALAWANVAGDSYTRVWQRA